MMNRYNKNVNTFVPSTAYSEKPIHTYTTVYKLYYNKAAKQLVIKSLLSLAAALRCINPLINDLLLLKID